MSLKVTHSTFLAPSLLLQEFLLLQFNNILSFLFLQLGTESAADTQNMKKHMVPLWELDFCSNSGHGKLLFNFFTWVRSWGSHVYTTSSDSRGKLIQIETHILSHQELVRKGRSGSQKQEDEARWISNFLASMSFQLHDNNILASVVHFLSSSLRPLTSPFTFLCLPFSVLWNIILGQALTCFLFLFQVSIFKFCSQQTFKEEKISLTNFKSESCFHFSSLIISFK